MIEEEQKKENIKVAAFLWDLILWAAGSYVLKTSWNYSLRQMFSLPYMNFSNAVAILSFVYIIARVAATGFMAELSKNIIVAMETINESLKEMAEKYGFSIKTRESPQDDSSNLN